MARFQPNSTYAYSSFSEKNSIRVLELHPGARQESISFNLRVESIDSPGSYEALSYTWGNDAPTCKVFCNGRSLLIRPNLMQALQRLRKQNEPRRLWIDALCINQIDLEEKSGQIPMMGRIYEQAERVLIWLGESSDNSSEAIKLVLRLNDLDEEDVTNYRDNYSRLLFGTQLSANSRDEKMSADVKGAEASIAAKLQATRLTPPNLTDWGCVRDFVKRPWFSRVWIVQEVALAKSALIHCGNDTLSWAVMGKVAGMMHPLGFPELAGGREWSIVSAINSVTVSEFRDSAPREIEGGFDPVADFRALVFCTCHASATDPRDRIYALLGLQERLTGMMPPVMVDYNMPVKDLYRDMTRFILGGRYTHLKSLPRNKFSRKNHTDHLPSWVHDFSATLVVGPMDGVGGGSISKFYGSVKIWGSDDPDELILDGRHMGVIQSCSKELSQTLNHEELARDLAKAMPAWLSLVAKSEFDEEKGLFSLARLLLTGTPWNSYSDTELLSFFKTWITVLTNPPHPPNEKPDPTLLPANVSTAIKRALRNCRKRRLCVTDKRTVCLAPAVTQQGDVVAYFAGGYSFFALRPRANHFELLGVCRVVKCDGDAEQTLREDVRPWDKITLK